MKPAGGEGEEQRDGLWEGCRSAAGSGFPRGAPFRQKDHGERSRTGLTFTMKFYAGDCLIARGVACATLSGGGLARFAVPG